MKLVREHINESILRGPTDEEIDKDLEGMTPEEMLIAGAKHGVLRAVERALESGANVHAQYDWALRQASRNGHAEAVKVLLDAGADVHPWDDEALRWASENGHVEVVKVLLDAGADVHAGNDEALRRASFKGHVEVVKVLLDAGADVHAGNDAALQLASAYGYAGIVKILKNHTAKEKRVKESLNEKFVEDSDPIKDMKIGFGKKPLTKSWKILEFIDSKGEEGASLIEIQYFIWVTLNNRDPEDFWKKSDYFGRSVNQRGSRGYWSTNLYGVNSGFYGNAGLLRKYCKKNEKGKWIIKRWPRPGENLYDAD